MPIAQHPWFRQGYIPDGRRERLVAGLTPEHRRLVLDIYSKLLDTDEAAQEVEDQEFVPIDDRIFTQFMLRERPGRSEKRFNSWMAGWSRNHWLGWFDARAALAVILALVIAGLAGTAAAIYLGDNTVKGPQTGFTALPVMVGLPGGEFLMGSPETEDGHFVDEGPQHRVKIDPFAIARTEVTVGQFADFLMATGYRRTGECILWDRTSLEVRATEDQAAWPGFDQNDDLPVVCVSWQDAQAYLAWLNEIDPPGGYRLPTEAEWEYAVRATTQSAHYWGEITKAAPEFACSYANGADRTLEDFGTGWQRLDI